MLQIHTDVQGWTSWGYNYYGKITNHLLFMDDLKMYVVKNIQVEQLQWQMVEINIWIYGLEKYAKAKGEEAN